MKCMATTQGPKIRINAILPGLLLTEWGLRYSEERQAELKSMAALKREVGLNRTLEASLTIHRPISKTAQMSSFQLPKIHPSPDKTFRLMQACRSFHSQWVLKPVQNLFAFRSLPSE